MVRPSHTTPCTSVRSPSLESYRHVTRIRWWVPAPPLQKIGTGVSGFAAVSLASHWSGRDFLRSSLDSQSSIVPPSRRRQRTSRRKDKHCHRFECDRCEEPTRSRGISGTARRPIGSSLVECLFQRWPRLAIFVAQAAAAATECVQFGKPGGALPANRDAGGGALAWRAAPAGQNT